MEVFDLNGQNLRGNSLAIGSDLDSCEDEEDGNRSLSPVYEFPAAGKRTRPECNRLDLSSETHREGNHAEQQSEYSQDNKKNVLCKKRAKLDDPAPSPMFLTSSVVCRMNKAESDAKSQMAVESIMWADGFRSVGLCDLIRLFGRQFSISKILDSSVLLSNSTCSSDRKARSCLEPTEGFGHTDPLEARENKLHTLIHCLHHSMIVELDHLFGSSKMEHSTAHITKDVLDLSLHSSSRDVGMAIHLLHEYVTYVTALSVGGGRESFHPIRSILEDLISPCLTAVEALTGICWDWLLGLSSTDTFEDGCEGGAILSDVFLFMHYAIQWVSLDPSHEMIYKGKRCNSRRTLMSQISCFLVVYSETIRIIRKTTIAFVPSNAFALWEQLTECGKGSPSSVEDDGIWWMLNEASNTLLSDHAPMYVRNPFHSRWLVSGGQHNTTDNQENQEDDNTKGNAIIGEGVWNTLLWLTASNLGCSEWQYRSPNWPLVSQLLSLPETIVCYPQCTSSSSDFSSTDIRSLFAQSAAQQIQNAGGGHLPSGSVTLHSIPIQLSRLAYLFQNWPLCSHQDYHFRSKLVFDWIEKVMSPSHFSATAAATSIQLPLCLISYAYDTATCFPYSKLSPSSVISPILSIIGMGDTLWKALQCAKKSSNSAISKPCAKQAKLSTKYYKLLTFPDMQLASPIALHRLQLSLSLVLSMSLHFSEDECAALHVRIMQACRPIIDSNIPTHSLVLQSCIALIRILVVKQKAQNASFESNHLQMVLSNVIGSFNEIWNSFWTLFISLSKESASQTPYLTLSGSSLSHTMAISKSDESVESNPFSFDSAFHHLSLILSQLSFLFKSFSFPNTRNDNNCSFSISAYEKEVPPSCLLNLLHSVIPSVLNYSHLLSRSHCSKSIETSSDDTDLLVLTMDLLSTACPPVVPCISMDSESNVLTASSDKDKARSVQTKAKAEQLDYPLNHEIDDNILRELDIDHLVSAHHQRKAHDSISTHCIDYFHNFEMFLSEKQILGKSLRWLEKLCNNNPYRLSDHRKKGEVKMIDSILKMFSHVIPISTETDKALPILNEIRALDYFACGQLWYNVAHPTLKRRSVPRRFAMSFMQNPSLLHIVRRQVTTSLESRPSLWNEAPVIRQITQIMTGIWICSLLEPDPSHVPFTQLRKCFCRGPHILTYLVEGDLSSKSVHCEYDCESRLILLEGLFERLGDCFTHDLSQCSDLSHAESVQRYVVISKVYREIVDTLLHAFVPCLESVAQKNQDGLVYLRFVMRVLEMLLRRIPSLLYDRRLDKDNSSPMHYILNALVFPGSLRNHVSSTFTTASSSSSYSSVLLNSSETLSLRMTIVPLFIHAWLSRGTDSCLFRGVGLVISKLMTSGVTSTASSEMPTDMSPDSSVASVLCETLTLSSPMIPFPSPSHIQMRTLLLNRFLMPYLTLASLVPNSPHLALFKWSATVLSSIEQACYRLVSPQFTSLQSCTDFSSDISRIVVPLTLCFGCSEATLGTNSRISQLLRSGSRRIIDGYMNRLWLKASAGCTIGNIIKCLGRRGIPPYPVALGELEKEHTMGRLIIDTLIETCMYDILSYSRNVFSKELREKLEPLLQKMIDRLVEYDNHIKSLNKSLECAIIPETLPGASVAGISSSSSHTFEYLSDRDVLMFSKVYSGSSAPLSAISDAKKSIFQTEIQLLCALYKVDFISFSECVYPISSLHKFEKVENVVYCRQRVLRAIHMMKEHLRFLYRNGDKFLRDHVEHLVCGTGFVFPLRTLHDNRVDISNVLF